MANESAASIQQAERVDHQLVRGIGIPALTANIVSSTIGAGIFVIPATVAAGLGPAAPLAFICCAIAMVLFINIRGVREGAGAVTTITIAKLLPLLLFVCAGIFFIHPANLTWIALPGSKALGDSVILLIFAFVGIEVALIPSGEVKNPSRTVPRAAYLALLITTSIYILIQLVAQGTLGVDLANHKDAPLAEAAAL